MRWPNLERWVNEALSQDAVIPLKATPGTGVSGTDYSVPNSVTVPTGSVSAAFDFTAASDTEEDDGETVELAFGTLPLGISRRGNASTTITILEGNDVTKPTVSFLSDTTFPTNGVFELTVQFNETVTGLEEAEIEVTNGTKSNFRGLGATYKLVITPNAGIEGSVSVQVAADAVVDGASNGNEAGSASFAVDMRPPTVSDIEITSQPGIDSTYAERDEIDLTVTFTEIVRVNGTPTMTLGLDGGENRTAAYSAGSGSMELAFRYEVASGDTDADGVSVDADSLGGSITDFAGNQAALTHVAQDLFSMHKVDGIKPTLKATTVIGSSLYLTYSEELDESSEPAIDQFDVTVGSLSRSVSAVFVSGRTVGLTLASAVIPGRGAFV